MVPPNGLQTDRWQNSRRSLPLPLRRFGQTLCAITFVSVAVELFCHFVLGLRYPYDSPMVAPQSRFDDLLDWLPQFSTIHTKAFFEQAQRVVYPAPMSALYAVFHLFRSAALPIYMLTAVATVVTALFLLYKAMRQAGIAARSVVAMLGILLVTSYPVAFLLYTANLELFVWIFVLAGLFCYVSGRHTLAACCFGIATAMKLYPILYMLLLLQQRKWKSVLIGISVAAVVTVGSLWLVYPDVRYSWQATQAGTRFFFQRDALHRLEGQLGYDHSLFAFIKTLLLAWTPNIGQKIWLAYAPLCAISVVCAWWFRVRHASTAERITFIAVVTILLPPVSYDYTLVHLYAPLAFLLLAVIKGKEVTRSAQFALACFAIALTSQGYIIARGDHYSAQLKALALVGLASSATFGFISQKDRESFSSAWQA